MKIISRIFFFCTRKISGSDQFNPMENDEPIDERSNDPASNEQPAPSSSSSAAALASNPASPVQAVPERDHGHNERLGRMRFVQQALEEEHYDQDERAVNSPIVEEVDDDDLAEAEPEADDIDVSDERSSNSSENGLDDSDADRLFDDYINNRVQQQSTSAEIYNTELPTEHAVSTFGMVYNFEF